MRAKGLKFRELVKTDLASGILSLGEDRAVLIEADALGQLRKELVDNLGTEIAQGILLRYGYRCGRNDALRLRDRYDWQSEMEWLLAGPKMHALEGMVKVKTEEVRIDRPRGVFSMEGLWINSLEAEQHVKLFGRSDTPVCWSLSGYASGYASAFFEQDIYAIETECIGRGDAVCRFEMKPADAWGAKAIPFKRHLEDVSFKLRFDHCLECIGNLSSQLMDVTEPKGYLESILKNSPEAIITTDEEGTIRFYSRGAEKLCGYPAEEVDGQSAAVLYAGGPAETDRLMDALREKGRLLNYQTEFITKDRHRIPIQAAVSLVRDQRGRTIGLLHIIRDVGEVRRLTRELEQRDSFLSQILLDSADAIITLDANDRITSWNKGAEAVYGYSEKEVLGKPLEILLPDELRASGELAKLSQYLRRDGIVRNYQTERVTKAGRRITVLLTRTAIKDDQNEIIGSSVIAKDITKIKGMERQLMRAEHFSVLGELAASLAHEIKNPLSGIKGAVEVIREEMPDDHPHKTILQDVLHEVHRIDKAVLDLLSYARPKEPDFGEVDLGPLLRRVVSLLQKPLREKSIEMGLVLGPDANLVWADAHQLEQLFINLVLNSIQAMDRPGAIRVSVKGATEQGVEIQIRDEGRGIPQEIKDKVFQPFFTTKIKGSGLGLAICQRIVADHHGFMDLKSTPGHGTVVRLWLPSVSNPAIERTHR